MSTNSDTMFSVTDDGRLTETPRCTRTSPCSKSDYLFCNRPVSNHHVHNPTEDLGNSAPISRSNKPTAPTDHWISRLTDAFKDAIMDHDIRKMVTLDHYYLIMTIKDPDSIHRYNRTELEKLSNTADRTIFNTIQLIMLVPRVYTTMDKDNNKGSVKHLQDEENSVKLKASPPETLQATQTSPTKIEEKS